MRQGGAWGLVGWVVTPRTGCPPGPGWSGGILLALTWNFPGKFFFEHALQRGIWDPGSGIRDLQQMLQSTAVSCIHTQRLHGCVFVFVRV
jgi:hypothetical protein